MDASRLLPVLGVFLFLLPLLHASGGLLTYLVYIFAAWLVLIGVAAGLAKSLSQSTLQGEDETGEGPL